MENEFGGTCSKLGANNVIKMSVMALILSVVALWNSVMALQEQKDSAGFKT